MEKIIEITIQDRNEICDIIDRLVVSLDNDERHQQIVRRAINLQRDLWGATPVFSARKEA